MNILYYDHNNNGELEFDEIITLLIELIPLVAYILQHENDIKNLRLKKLLTLNSKKDISKYLMLISSTPALLDIYTIIAKKINEKFNFELPYLNKQTIKLIYEQLKLLKEFLKNDELIKMYI